MNIGSELKKERIEHLDLKSAVSVEPDMALSEVVRKMQAGRTGCATVIKGGKVKGVFTERDLILKVLAKGADLSQPVQDVMTPNPHVLKPSDSVAKAVEMINKHKHRSIPIVDSKGSFVGLISVRTITNFLAEHFPTEVYNLPPSPEIQAETAEGG